MRIPGKSILACLALSICLTRSAAAANLLPGDYAEDGFLRTLAETRSPIAALRAHTGYPQSIHVTQNLAGVQFTANLNWHEGYILYILRDDGSVQLGEEQVAYLKPVIETPTAFVFFGQHPAPQRHFIYVADMNDLVVSLSLSGLYKTDAGKLVEFRNNHILAGLGPDTSYSLDNDHVAGPDWDYVKLGDGDNHILAFRHDGRNLVLYPVVAPSDPDADYNDLGRPDYAHPVAYLHWISDATQ